MREIDEARAWERGERYGAPSVLAVACWIAAGLLLAGVAWLALLAF